MTAIGDLDSSQRMSWLTWGFAASVAVMVHAGFLALAWNYIDADPDPELGAPAMEIGFEPTAPPLDPINLPPGPDTEQSSPTPPAVEQAELIEPPVLLRDTPIETDDPELVTIPVETKKPEEQRPVPVSPTNPSVAAIAAEATALPTMESVKEAARSIAPDQGIGESRQRVRATWQKELIAHLDRHKRYPSNPLLQNATVLVRLVIDESGHILSASIFLGSGDDSFDDAALAMIARSDPVPKPPAVVVAQGLSFTLPVVFRAKRLN